METWWRSEYKVAGGREGSEGDKRGLETEGGANENGGFWAGTNRDGCADIILIKMRIDSVAKDAERG